MQKCIRVEKKKELDLANPNNTFKVSKKAHHPCCKLSPKCKSDKEKAVIECEKQLNTPLQEHKKSNNKPTKADFDIHFNPSTHARKKKPPQKQPQAEKAVNKDPNYVPSHKGKDLARALHHCEKHCRKTEKTRKTTPITMMAFARGIAEHAFPKRKGKSQVIKNTAKAARKLVLLRPLFPQHTLKLEIP